MNVPSLGSPIVLVHGLLGFDQLRLARRSIAWYFPGIVEYLQAAGNRVFLARLPGTGGVALRARKLGEFLDRVSPGEPVHLFAHSMGGLDARYLIGPLGQASRVLSLTTLGTPHRGSYLADWGIRRFERLIKPIFRWLGWPDQAFYDLTTAGCRAFNIDVPDHPDVRYFSVAGRCQGPWVGLEWQFPHRLMSRHEGDNDGCVSLESARWGESMEIWDGDHLNLVNWPNMTARLQGLWRDRAPNYGRLVQRLYDEGF